MNIVVIDHGMDNHYIIEAYGRALRMTCTIDGRAAEQMPSTKDCL